MQTQELKSLVESGHYKPDPSRVAAAMLQRRGVRELLVGGTLSRAGRTPPGPAVPPPGSLISTPAPAPTSPIRVSPIPRFAAATTVLACINRCGGSAASSS